MVDQKQLEVVKELLEKSKRRKFNETIELAIHLKGVDLSQPKNRIEEEIILPHGRGKNIKIGVFAGGDLAFKSKNVADLLISPEEIETLSTDKRKMRKLANEYTFFLAEAPLMITIGKKLGPILGPRSKMPKPIAPQADPVPIIQNLKKSVKVRTKDRPTFHIPVGTRDMPLEKLSENIDTILNRIISKLEKGTANIGTVHIKTSMSNAVRLM